MKLINGHTLESVRAALYKHNSGKKANVSVATPWGEEQECQYQAPDGNRCFVGCFIPDGHPGLRHKGGVESLLINYPELQERMPLESRAHPPGTPMVVRPNTTPLWRFQAVHDDAPGDSVGDLRELGLAWLEDRLAEEELPT